MSNTNKQKPNSTSSGARSTGGSTSQKPTSPQVDVMKHILEFKQMQQNFVKDLDTLKKGVSTNTTLLLKISGKIQSPNQAKKSLSAEDVKNLHNAATEAWKNKKKFTEDELEELAATALNIEMPVMSLDSPDQGKLEAAAVLLKEYIRTSKQKAFNDRIDLAVQQYFADNDQIDEGEEDGHIQKILQVRNWTKTNPTESDIELAEIMIRKRVLELSEYGEFQKRKSPSKPKIQQEEPPTKKQKIGTSQPHINFFQSTPEADNNSLY